MRTSNYTETDPWFERGALVWHKDKKETLHITGRRQDIDHGTIIYRLQDLSHTAATRLNHVDARDILTSLDIAVDPHKKPVERFNISDLVRKIDEQDGPPRLLDEDDCLHDTLGYVIDGDTE